MGGEHRPAALRALDAQRTGERVDPVGDAHEAVALGIRPSYSVVADLEGEGAVIDRSLHRRPRCSGVLHDVRERLGGDEVRARLEIRVQPLAQDVDIDREIQPGDERADTGAQPALGERRRQDAVCQLAYLGRGALGSGKRLREESLRIAAVLAERPLSSSRLSAFAIAVSSSWAKLAIRSSVSSGGGPRAAQMPNGYCGLPLQQTCPHPNACLTCDHFVTTAEFLPAHRDQLARTEQMIEQARSDGRQRLVDMNQPIRDNLHRIITGLQAFEENDDEPR